MVTQVAPPRAGTGLPKRLERVWLSGRCLGQVWLRFGVMTGGDAMNQYLGGLGVFEWPQLQGITTCSNGAPSLALEAEQATTT